jgi:hypothetical protein
MGGGISKHGDTRIYKIIVLLLLNAKFYMYRSKLIPSLNSSAHKNNFIRKSWKISISISTHVLGLSD